MLLPWKAPFPLKGLSANCVVPLALDIGTELHLRLLFFQSYCSLPDLSVLCRVEMQMCHDDIIQARNSLQNISFRIFLHAIIIISFVP